MKDQDRIEISHDFEDYEKKIVLYFQVNDFSITCGFFYLSSESVLPLPLVVDLAKIL